MSYIGATPLIGNFQKCDAITTSATDTFNLLVGGVAVSPAAPQNCIVSLNGVVQAPTSAYTISGSTIVFASALTTSDVIDFIVILGNVLDLGTPSDDTVTAAKLNDTVISGQTALGAEPADTDEFLVSDAGVIKRVDYSYIKPGGSTWTFIKSITASADADVQFKNGVSDVVFDGTYSAYQLWGFGVVGASDTANVKMRISTDTGSSYKSSGYDIRYVLQGGSVGAGSQTDCFMFIDDTGTGTGERCCFRFDFYNPAQTTDFPRGNWQTSYTDSSGDSYYGSGSAIYETTGAIDAFQIIMSTGNISGIFKLYGLTGS